MLTLYSCMDYVYTCVDMFFLMDTGAFAFERTEVQGVDAGIHLCRVDKKNIVCHSNCFDYISNCLGYLSHLLAYLYSIY